MDDGEIITLLGSVLAQDDPSFLQYYVERSSILDTLLDQKRPFVIVNSPRGSGKSGLLIALAFHLSKVSTKQHVVIRKFYTDVEFPTNTVAVDQFIAFWKNTLYGWIVEQIGKRIGIAFSDDDISAVELAEKSGSKEVNYLTSLMKRLKFNALPIEKLEYDGTLRPEQSFRIIHDSSATFWLLLDEMDDYYEGSDLHNARLVGLMQACKVIASSFPNVKIRFTIRPHIMTILKYKYEKVQTYWQNELSIAWKSEELKQILAKRILYFDDKNFERQELLAFNESARSEDATRSAIIARYFDDFDMSFKIGATSEYRALATLSFGRPRWMLEFCYLALQNSETRRASVISFQKAMHDYGSNRITFLIGEYRHQFPQLDAYINVFATERRVIFGTSLQLREFIIKHIIDTHVFKFDHDSSQSKDQLAREVAACLYMVEFIRPRQNLGGRDHHRFIYYNEHPELLATWPDAQNLEWHMHPTFAKALTIDQNYTYRKGSGMREVGIVGESGKKKRLEEHTWRAQLAKLEGLYVKSHKSDESSA